VICAMEKFNIRYKGFMKKTNVNYVRLNLVMLALNVLDSLVFNALNFLHSLKILVCILK